MNKNLRALESLGEPVKQWDTLLIHILSHKLDSKSYREWEELKGRLDKSKSIELDTFITFLRNRADLIETLELSRNQTAVVNQPQGFKSPTKLKTFISVQDPSCSDTQSVASSISKCCPNCNNESHNLVNCPQFLSLTPNARLKSLFRYKICFNCFRSGHYANHCKKPGCKLCKRRHNTLIHVTNFERNQAFNDSTISTDNVSPAGAVSCCRSRL